jgi:hypothetical protein
MGSGTAIRLAAATTALPDKQQNPLQNSGF